MGGYKFEALDFGAVPCEMVEWRIQAIRDDHGGNDLEQERSGDESSWGHSSKVKCLGDGLTRSLGIRV